MSCKKKKRRKSSCDWGEKTDAVRCSSIGIDWMHKARLQPVRASSVNV